MTEFHSNTSVSACQSGGVFLLQNGTVWESNGDLGDEIENDYLTDITSVSAGYEFTLFLDSNKKVWVTGANTSDGSLGVKSKKIYVRKPKKIRKIRSINAIVAGYAHALLLDEGGAIWGHGRNESGQLGLGSRRQVCRLPHKIAFPVKIVTLATSYDHTLFIDDGMRIWAAGSNEYGKLGLPINRFAFEPVQLENQFECKSVSAGMHYSSFLDFNEQVWMCGGRTAAISFGSTIAPVDGLNNIQRMYSGPDHAFFITNEGSVWALGQNEYGQLGLEDKDYRTPTNVETLPPIHDIATAASFSIFLDYSGDYWYAGNTKKHLCEKQNTVQRIKLPHPIMIIPHPSRNNPNYTVKNANKL